MKFPVPSLIILFLAAGGFSVADTLPISLPGTTSTGLWGPGSLSNVTNPGFPGALNFAQPWPSSIPATNGGDAFLTKLANGASGAPIPSGQSIYFVSFSNTANAFGGTLAVNDPTPLAGLSTLAFQIEIGGANGYDLHNNNLAQPPDLSTVKLNYTTSSGATGSLTASSQALLDRFYTFAIDMPVGPNGEDVPVDVYNRLYGLQWDLSTIGPIASYQVEFSGVEHAQLYQLRLDQSDQASASSVFPRDAVWTATGADSRWESAANWQENTVPGNGRNLRLVAGNEALLGTTPSAKSITFATSDAFTLRSENASAISLASGINSSSPATVTHRVAVPVLLEKYNLFDLAAGNTLAIDGPVTGAGFYKQGPGNLHLTGENHFDAAASSFQENGLIFSGGDNIISGSNTFSGIASATFNIRPDTGVRLLGSGQPLDGKFVANLLGSTSRLILGDEISPVAQTFHSLTGSVTGVPVTGSRILGGSPAISTLTLSQGSGTATFAGDIGGPGLYENNLSLVKAGPGLQILTGGTSHNGNTLILGGTLALNPNGHSIELNGGVLGLQATDHSANLGAGPGEIHFTGSGGFAANGIAGSSSSDPAAVHTINLNDGATLAWNNGGFLADGQKLILSAANTNRTIQFANPLDLGNIPRVIEVGDSAQETDARLGAALGGTSDLFKTGAGLLELSADNSYSGKLRLQSGTVTIAGSDGTFAGDVIAGPGTFFRIVNTSAARDQRLSPSSEITLLGSFLTFTAAPGGNTENASTLTIGEGTNSVSTSRAAEGASTRFSFSELVRHPTAIVNFSGASIGLADARNEVRFTTPPVLSHGIVGGWAVTANEFATYGTNGVTAFNAYSTAAESAWTAADNIKLTAGSASSPTATLSAGRTIHSLRLVGATGGSFGNVLDLGANSLSIQSGGVLTNSGADSRSTKIRNGVLTAPTELLLTTNGVAEISATIADPAPGSPLTLVKSGSQILNLLSPATYTGPTLINQGVLNLREASSLASTEIEIKSGATLRVTSFSTPYEIPATRTISGLGTVDGNVSSLGTIAPAPSSRNVLSFSGNLSFVSGSTLHIPIEPSSALALAGSIKSNGTLAIAAGTRLRISSTDPSSEFWNRPHSFPIVTAAAFAGNYAASPPLLIESDLTGGSWTVIYDESSISIEWSPAATIRQWRNTHFGIGNNEGDAADLADPDHDGIVNLIEYALGSAPDAYDPTANPAFAPATGFTFEIPATPPSDLTYQVQISDNLAGWNTLATLAPGSAWQWNGDGPSAISLITLTGKTRVSITDDEASSHPARRFMRLKATYPSP